MNVPGLTYRPDFLDAAEEAELIAIIDRQPWITELKRRVQHYGYRYDYKRRAVDEAMRLGPLPDWLGGLLDRVSAEGGLAQRPDQVIVNEYEPGQGIAPHIDCVPCFAEDIASVSLGSGCAMTFRQARSDCSTELYLAPRSLLVLRGDARYKWRHGIPARLSDLVGTSRIPRGRRISLTFRTIER